MNEELKFITQREAELDERIRAIERTIHINSLCESIQDYKDQVKILQLRSKKVGRFGKLLGFARSHSIVTRY